MVHFSLISTRDEFDVLCQELSKKKILAIDIECENNLHHYGAYVSIIQISTKDKHYVVDVLALREIDALIEILENPHIEKIFHDVSFDLRILNHQFNCRPKNIVDTQLAALLLGIQKIGLGSLLEDLFGEKKEKKFQMIDWTKRPLSTAMLNYAVKDTAFLHKLKDKLEQELIAQQRMEWFTEECKDFETQDFTYNEQTYIDIPGVKAMPDKQRAIFHALFDKRNELAKKVDRPPFMVCSNKQLVAFSANPPDWRHVKRVHPIIKREARALYELVKKAKRGPGESYNPHKRKRMTTAQYQNSKKITELRNTKAAELGIMGYLLISNDNVREIALTNSLDCLKEWQKKIVEPILRPILS